MYKKAISFLLPFLIAGNAFSQSSAAELLQSGNKKHQESKFKEAIEDYTKAMALDSTDNVAFYYRANAH